MNACVMINGGNTISNTLLARPVVGKPNTWHLDIRLQGAAETIFFDI